MCPMNNRTDTYMVETFKDVYEYLDTYKCELKLNVIDNECRRTVQQYIKSKQVNI